MSTLSSSNKSVISHNNKDKSQRGTG